MPVLRSVKSVSTFFDTSNESWVTRVTVGVVAAGVGRARVASRAPRRRARATSGRAASTVDRRRIRSLPSGWIGEQDAACERRPWPRAVELVADATRRAGGEVLAAQRVPQAVGAHARGRAADGEERQQVAGPAVRAGSPSRTTVRRRAGQPRLDRARPRTGGAASSSTLARRWSSAAARHADHDDPGRTRGRTRVTSASSRSVASLSAGCRSTTVPAASAVATAAGVGGVEVADDDVDGAGRARARGRRPESAATTVATSSGRRATRCVRRRGRRRRSPARCARPPIRDPGLVAPPCAPFAGITRCRFDGSVAPPMAAATLSARLSRAPQLVS